MSGSEIELSPEELVRELAAGTPLHLLDVRAPERAAENPLDLVPPAFAHRRRGSEVLAEDDPSRSGLDPAAPLVVVCSRGRDSLVVTRHLRARGVAARSLAGGMAAWSRTLIERQITAPAPLDLVLQLDRVAKGALAYLLASDGRALVVDPPRDSAAIEAAIAVRSLELVGVAETHVHADFLSGAAQLARRHGVPHLVHGRDLTLPYDGRRSALETTDLAAEREISLGRARIAIEPTPGHTEGSVTFRVGDTLALTGDFVFVGSVGRPDLGGRTETWTDELFASLERARRDWPEDLVVLPGHYAGAAERRADGAVAARFGDLLESNEPLGLRHRDAFRAWVAARVGDYPERYRRIKAINLGLEWASPEDADELDAGRNRCALA